MRHGLIRRSLLVVSSLLVLAVPGLAQTDLLISEYVEGTSNNKALELYNPTAAAIDLNLGGYSVQIFSNGNTTASSTISLQGVVAAGGRFVLANSSAVLGVTPNQTSGSVNFNGDDAVTLRKGTTVIDSLGQIGFDPGTEWGSGVVSTADNTLRRKSSVCTGDTNPNDVFTPSTQWDGFATDTFSGLGSHTASCGSGGTTTCSLFFSESVEGSSNNKVLEIYNPGPSSVSLSGYSVEIYFNGSATVGSTIALTSTATLASGGVWVLAHSSATPSIPENQASGSLTFNGDDAIVLKRNTTVIDSIGQVGVDPGTEWGTGTASTADNTLRRKSTACSGDTVTNDAFTPSTQWDGFATDTFSGLGSHTANCTCSGPAAVEIWQIQGSGTASPYAGQSVTTNGNVVTAVGPDGFFLQTPDARVDADPATSNGIFVFTGSAPGVAAGDVVNVTGNVVEFFDFTEFSGGLTVTKTGTAAVPVPVNLNPPGTCGSAGHLERYEGMRVRVANGTVSGPTDQFGDASIVATAARPFREPGIECPGTSGLPVWDGNPEVFEIDPDRLGLANVDLAGGAVIVEAVGGLGYAFGDYQIWPTTLNFSGVAAPGPVRAEAAGEFTVGAQNLLRLFDTVDDPATSDEVPTNAQYNDRLNKLSLQVRTVLRSPEILAVSEAENLTVLQDLADEIETDDPSVVYTPYLLEGNDVGGIDVGFLVRGSFTVSNVYQWGKNDTYTFNGQTLTLNDRPPLVLEGTYTGCGTAFPLTVIAIHQRSLSGIDGTDGPRVREKRHQQALRLSQFIQSLQAANPNLRLVVAGDFNAFQFTDGYVDVMGQVTGNPDPLGAMIPATDEVNPDLTNRTLSAPAAGRYSFVFGGTAQTLDHVLTSQPLNPYVTGFEHSRGNSDAPNGFGAVSTTPLRSSDHDGAVLFLSCTASGG
jgi:predicted extracellular nuclease